MGRGLGEVLLPVKVLQGQRFALPQGGQGGFLLLFLLVLALLIHGGVAGEFQAGGAGPEAVSRRLDLHGVDHADALPGVDAAAENVQRQQVLFGDP